MKAFANIIAVTMALGLAPSVSAQRAEQSGIANKTFQKADSAESIKAMKKGDRYAVVCRECDSITVKEVDEEKDLEAMCHDGGTMHCPSCKKKYTVKSVGNRAGANPVISKVTIVNAEGKECMFVVPLKS
ncbi:MAG: hypothetical protein H8M99_08115 [Gloeobacteraceae cyanobacterium ES-bin-144]|nr:hypothetical protein [Verrucomicrobiales bacterium]